MLRTTTIDVTYDPDAIDPEEFQSTVFAALAALDGVDSVYFLDDFEEPDDTP
jgi:hypothetical protein